MSSAPLNEEWATRWHRMSRSSAGLDTFHAGTMQMMAHESGYTSSPLTAALSILPHASCCRIRQTSYLCSLCTHVLLPCRPEPMAVV